MNRLSFPKLFICFLLILPGIYASAEENFLLINGTTNEAILKLGPHLNKRITPCCTFNIALSLMGYEEGILENEETPNWPFKEGYVHHLESWKTSQTPKSWIKNSCVWYSQVLAFKLGLKKIQHYLALLEYGNQDMSGKTDAWLDSSLNIAPNAWIRSSLEISPEEQVAFIQKMIHKKIPISNHSIQMTKKILFVDELPEGWKLFGKTGGTVNDPDDSSLEIGWFVGWVEKDDIFFPFAYNIREKKVNHIQKVPRVKQLLVESKKLFKIDLLRN